MERETGIEPAPSAWKAEVLPLNYSRAGAPQQHETLGGGRWIRTTEGVSQQIYSLPPLAAWVSLRMTLVSGLSGRGETAGDSGVRSAGCQRLRAIFHQAHRCARSGRILALEASPHGGRPWGRALWQATAPTGSTLMLPRSVHLAGAHVSLPRFCPAALRVAHDPTGPHEPGFQFRPR